MLGVTRLSATLAYSTKSFGITLARLPLRTQRLAITHAGALGAFTGGFHIFLPNVKDVAAPYWAQSMRNERISLRFGDDTLPGLSSKRVQKGFASVIVSADRYQLGRIGKSSGAGAVVFWCVVEHLLLWLVLKSAGIAGRVHLRVDQIGADDTEVVPPSIHRPQASSYLLAPGGGNPAFLVSPLAARPIQNRSRSLTRSRSRIRKITENENEAEA